MGSDKIEKEHKHGNQIIGSGKFGEALLGLVPSLELLVETFDQVVGDIILEAFDTDVLGFRQDGLDREFISAIAVGNDCLWVSHVFDGI